MLDKTVFGPTVMLGKTFFSPMAMLGKFFLDQWPCWAKLFLAQRSCWVKLPDPYFHLKRQNFFQLKFQFFLSLQKCTKLGKNLFKFGQSFERIGWNIILPIALRTDQILLSWYHCMADLLLILCGFSCFAYAEWTTVLLVWSNPN